MVDRNILIEKTNQMQNCLKRIADKTGLRPESLDDLDIQEIFVLNLQRAIQAALDLAAYSRIGRVMLPNEFTEHGVL